MGPFCIGAPILFNLHASTIHFKLYKFKIFNKKKKGGGGPVSVGCKKGVNWMTIHKTGVMAVHNFEGGSISRSMACVKPASPTTG